MSMNNKQQLTNSKQYQAIKQAYAAYKQEQEDIEWSKLALQNAGLTVEEIIHERIAKTYSKTAEMVSLAVVIIATITTFVLYI